MKAKMDSEPFTLINITWRLTGYFERKASREKGRVGFFSLSTTASNCTSTRSKSISSPQKKMSEPVVQRIVPGAPPPTPLSKSQKKKRKPKAKSAEPGDGPALPEATSAAPTEKTPELPDAQEATLAPEVIAQSDSQMSLLPEEEVLLKPSPIVDLIHKRLKATTKKIVFILVFSNTVWLIFLFFPVTDIYLRCYRP